MIRAAEQRIMAGRLSEPAQTDSRALHEAAAVWVDRRSLVPWGKNPRKNDAAVKKVVESIRRFGFASPIIARRENNEVIAGHTRLKAAEVLGLDRVPVRYLDLDPAEAHLLALADNKLNEVAEWIPADVASILSEYSLEDAELAGFDSSAIDALANELGAEDAPSELGGLLYKVVVECDDEQQQAEILQRLEAEGFKCQPLIS